MIAAGTEITIHCDGTEYEVTVSRVGTHHAIALHGKYYAVAPHGNNEEVWMPLDKLTVDTENGVSLNIDACDVQVDYCGPNA